MNVIYIFIKHNCIIYIIYVFIHMYIYSTHIYIYIYVMENEPRNKFCTQIMLQGLSTLFITLGKKSEINKPKRCLWDYSKYLLYEEEWTLSTINYI